MRAIGFVLLAVTAIACGEKSTAPPPVASLSVVASAASLEAGELFSLTAVARDAAGTVLEGRPVEWQSSAPAIVNVSAAPGAATAVAAAVAPGVATITATAGGRSGTVVLAVRPRPGADYAITAAQWTQGVQQADGAIPVVLNGNAAVLNVLLSSTSAARAPGRIVLTLRDSNNVVVRSDTARPTALNGSTDYLLPPVQFLVPASVLRAGLLWDVQREPAGTDIDADPSNDRWPRTGFAPLTTVVLPPMHIRFVPVVLSEHANARGDVNTANIPAYLQTFNRIFPRSTVTTSVGTPLASAASFGTPPSGGGQAFWLQVLQDIDLARVADVTAGDAYWMGVIRPPVGFNNTAFGGFAYIPPAFASVGPGTRSSTVVQVGWFQNSGQTTDLVTHELGHTLGRRHTPCGGASGPDPQYPIPGGTIGTVGHDVYAWSIGQRTSAVAQPTSIGDVMSYCFPQWASPYTYLGMLLARSASTVSAANRMAVMGGPESVLVVRGVVQDGALTVHPAVHIRGVATAAGEGPYQLDLLTRDGRSLLTHTLRLSDVDHAPAQTFIASIPLRLIDTTALAAIRVRGPAGVVTRRTGQAQTPQLASMRGRRVSDVASLVRVSADGALASGRAAFASATPAPSIEAVCADSRSAAIVVQDASSGAVLATALSARTRLPNELIASVDISCSDGVRSEMRRRVAVPR
jgi:hypothetical protein